MSDLAREIAEELASRHYLVRGTEYLSAVADVAARHIATAEAARDERDRYVRLLLGGAEYALDDSPKWEDEDRPPMTRGEARRAVQKALALLEGREDED